MNAQTQIAEIDRGAVRPASPSLMVAIINAASNPEMDPAKLKLLMEMKEKMDATTRRLAFTSAFVTMQPQLPTIDRHGKIVIHNKDDRNKGISNPRVEQSTAYALLEDINDAIKPLLFEHGFALSFRSGTTPEGKITVTGILRHRDGHEDETTFVLTHDSTGSKNAVQAVGSSNKYGMRYATIMLLNISSRAPIDMGSDDDGKSAGASGAISEEQFEHLRKVMVETGANEVKFLDFYKIDDVSMLPAKKLDEAIAMLHSAHAARKARESAQ